MEKKRVEWHPGFYAAIQLDLKDEEKHFDYSREHNLNTKPIAVDLLVIKKPASYKPKHVIAKLFRGHNILEYKNPKAGVNIDTLYKTYGYACLYKSYGKKVDSIKDDDITVSLVKEKKPVKLFSILRSKGTPVEKAYKGIYYVRGAVLFPTQFIITEELDDASALWLRGLTEHLEVKQAREMIRRAIAFKNQGDRRLAESVLDVSASSNKKVFDSLKEDHTMYEALKEIMAPEWEEQENRAREKGRAEGRAEGREGALISLVKKNLITAAQAAKEMGISERAFKARLKRS